MSNEDDIQLPPGGDGGEVVSWNDVDGQGGIQAIGAEVIPGPNSPNHPDNQQKGKLRVGVIGNNYLADATRICFDAKLNDVYTVASEDELDSLIEYKPQVVFVCVDLPLLKNDTIDDAALIAMMVRFSKETQAGVCLKTTINSETADRIAAATGAEWFVKKFLYSPELNETVDGVLSSDIMFVGGTPDVIEAHMTIMRSGTVLLPKRIINGTINEVIFAKLGAVGFKAVKQTFFNQLHQAILDIEGANPSVVRQILTQVIEHDDVLMIPTFIRAQADSNLTMKQARSFGGEFANTDVKMLSSMTDRLTVLEECINLRNLKD